MGYFNSLGTCDLCLQKLQNLKDSNRFLGVFIAEESIRNPNNSMNIKKNSKSFLGMPIETRGSCLMKKTKHEKSRDTVPLRKKISFIVHLKGPSDQIRNVLKFYQSKALGLAIKKFKIIPLFL